MAAQQANKPPAESEPVIGHPILLCFKSDGTRCKVEVQVIANNTFVILEGDQYFIRYHWESDYREVSKEVFNSAVHSSQAAERYAENPNPLVEWTISELPDIMGYASAAYQTVFGAVLSAAGRGTTRSLRVTSNGAEAATESATAAARGTGALARSGPVPRSLGAMSRAERIARKLKLNLESATARQVLNSLDETVSSFVGQFRKAKILRELPSEVLDLPVENALKYSTKVRKLLIDGRFVK